MKSRKAVVLVIVLIVITSIAAIAHLSTRRKVPEHALLVSVNEEEILLDIDKFEYEQVSGVRVNGKGEEIQVEGQGISVGNVLNQAEITDYIKVTVVSDDSYRAELLADEINESGKAYLLNDENELRLIVFGDENSKRSVSNVVQIIVE